MKFGNVSIDDVRKEIDEGSSNYQRSMRHINKLLEESPNDPNALYLKAKVFCLMKGKEFKSVDENKKKKIREVAIKYADDIIRDRNIAKCYKAKADALGYLDLRDAEILEARLEAYKKARDLGIDPRDGAHFVEKFIDEIEGGEGGHEGDTRNEPPRAPIAAFKANIRAGNIPCFVQFQDTSMHTDSRTKWVWDFGDNTSSNERNPSHEYTSPGSYTVSLVVTNGSGHSDKRTEIDYIKIVPEEKTGKIDPDGLYRKKLIDLITSNPGIIEQILCAQEQKLQLKGFLYDSFDGETPKAFHILVNCIEEMIPYTICKFREDTQLMDNRLFIRQKALTERGYSEESIIWGVDSWKNALSPHFQKFKIETENEPGDFEFTF